MIFRGKEMCALVLSGQKTQTRRLVKLGETLITDSLLFGDRILMGSGYCKWQVGRTYAVQPGRGKKAVGRIRITAIRRERLQDISEEDAIAEGMFKESHPIALKPVTRYMHLWDSIHKKPGTRFADDPEVWVLEFEVTR